MKNAHILNIGYPKCGTTWLWDTLVKNNSISDHRVKENDCLITGTSVIEYCRQYTQDTTANFSTANIVLDQYVIEQLSHLPQISVSIILRDPLELLWSTYVFTKIKDIDFATYCYRMYDSKWFTSSSLIVNRWKNYFGDRFTIFWYESLKENNLKFYLDYCDKMHLDPGNAEMPGKINVTRYKQEMPKIDQDINNLLKLEFEKIKVYK